MKIIHQIWFQFDNAKLDDSNERTILKDSITTVNSDYIYMMWDFQSALKFTEKYYPWYLDFMLIDTNRPIIKCDFFRYLVMYHFGGVYFDIDFMIIQNLDQLLFKKNSADIILTKESHNCVEVHKTLHNGFLFSRKPNHQFFKNLCDNIVEKSKTYDMLNIDESTVYTFTGTKFIYTNWLKDDNVSKIEILPFHILCNHWFINKNDKEFYTQINSSYITSIQSRWCFLTISDVKAHQEQLIANGAFGVCIVMRHSSYWK